jgi:hypothetical protein
MDRSEGRDAGKTDEPTASPISPGRAAGRESREGSDGGDEGDDGGRQERCPYVRGDDTARLQVTAELQSSFFTHLYFIYYFISSSFIIQLDLDPSSNSAMDFVSSITRSYRHNPRPPSPSDPFAAVARGCRPLMIT